MSNLFITQIENLTIEDIQLLNTLTSNESVTRFSAQTKEEIIKSSHLTESLFRKSVTRLSALQLIQIVNSGRNHSFYVTQFGQEAINYIAERGNV